MPRKGGVPENLRPPWKPGQSGNPSGRPRKKPILDRYLEMVEKVLPEELRKKLGLDKGATYGDALALRIMQTAILKGKHEAAKEVREAIEGRAPQAVHLSGPGGKPVRFAGQAARPLKGISPERLLEIVALAERKAKEAEGEPLPPAP